MSTRTLAMSDRIHEYLLSVTLRESEPMRRLRDETAKLPNSRMQISPEQGQLMALLVELLGARQAIEVGVFTGYSALSVALALPSDGRLIACDVNEEWTAIARRYWEEAGVAAKIELRLAPAHPHPRRRQTKPPHRPTTMMRTRRTAPHRRTNRRPTQTTKTTTKTISRR